MFTWYGWYGSLPQGPSPQLPICMAVAGVDVRLVIRTDRGSMPTLATAENFLTLFGQAHLIILATQGAEASKFR